MSRQEFEVEIQKPEGYQVAFIIPPLNAEEVFGTKAQVKVKGTIDGIAYRTSIAPMGDGTHSMIITLATMKTIGKQVGDKIHVLMEQDDEVRIIVVPEDFRRALNASERAKANFERFAYRHRKAYVDWVESAKKPETRLERIKQSVERIAEGVKR